jgi:murein DD-endopeptidase MepM/ murein hydrolase activator NlpD
LKHCPLKHQKKKKMRKVYYIYNTETNTYERVYPTFRQRVLHILKRLFVGMGFGAGSFILLIWIFGSPSENQLRIENSRLLAQYNVLSRRLDEALGVMQGIQQRDDNLYRVVLQADPVADAVRKAGYGGTNRYEDLMDLANADLVVNTTQKMDMLNRQLYIQSKSFDEVVELFKGQDEMLQSIPAIQPVANKDLKRTASGYGMRIDPIYKTAKFHAGMDFSANTGTPVYATGNGRVKKAGWQSGYGKIIIVDHGFGYETWYAHLNKYNVRVGQKVIRGEVIGEVGNTGKSTGPHLHYEVHLKGKVMNPVNYYFMDLSAEEYDKMIELAANQGKVFD